MSRPRARFIADLLQTHLDDLAFLASQRRQALASRQHTLKGFGEINDRIDAHLQGLRVAPASHLLPWLTEKLSSAERDEAFAAAHVLLRLDEAEAAQAVLIAFSRSKGATLAGLRDALSLAPLARTGAEVQSALAHAKPEVAVAAAVVLANHRALDVHEARLASWLQDEDAELALWAWRAVHLADVAAKSPPPMRPLKAGVTHASPAVRHAAWHAAAWIAPAQTLAALRQKAQGEDPVAWHWLAVLGGPDDAPLIQHAVKATPQAQGQCALLARYGHPMGLNALLRWMDTGDVPLAVAAGEAFTRITAWDIRGERRPLPVSDDADDFARAMAPDVWVPDAARARSLMEQQGQRWQEGTRWCLGKRLDGEVSGDLLLQLDLEARWDVAARAALAGRPCSAPMPVF
jgi:uncharacterized protein (TIGR02270 family)